MRIDLFSTFYRKSLTSAGILVLSVLYTFFYFRFGTSAIVITIGFIALFFVFLFEFVLNKAENSPPLLIFLAVASLPFQNLFLTTFPLKAIGQLSVIFIALLYWAKLSAFAKADFIKRVSPITLITATFLISISVAYFLSGSLENKDKSFLIDVLGAVSYTYLACIYCSSLGNIKKIIWLLIFIGVIQLPVMIAMSRGWTESLPGPLSVLSVQSYGGVASDFSSSAFRYPGLFGDYELLAEYLDVMILFCIGIALFSFSSKERFIAILAAILMVIAGFYTGTRAFVASLAVGVAVLIILSIIRFGFGKNLLKLLGIGILLVFIFYWMSTLDVFQGYITRFFATDLSAGYFDTRETVWTTSLAMMNHLPFTGYGAQLSNLFDVIGNGDFLSPHSLYFSMILLAGIPGLIAVSILVLTPFLWLGRIIYNKKSKQIYAWAIVFLSIWTFWVVNEIKIEFIRYGFYMNFIFFLIGIMASFFYLARRTSTVDARL